jgi:asparagine synthase (glutamine-hydrolysing)
MCGIAGIFRYRSERPIPGGVLDEMVRRLAHRGPDDRGTFQSPRVALGHTRLSIIDLSPLGHQPFSDEGGRYTLVYNGEIYNFRKLRAWLEQRGHRFRSQTDSEVVLRSYIELGEACVERLIGMFAFAIWDRQDETLFLARDRIGEKPLVYADVGGSFVFASEIHALLADPDIPREPDPVAILTYLGTTKAIPFPRTAYAHVKKLPPAHTLTVSAAGSALRRYWIPDFGRKRALSLDDAVDELEGILAETVSSMMMSDVPIGLLLSGGVDSSTIAFKMRACTDNMHTFACGGSADDEEFLRARAVAAHLGTRHDEHIFTLKPELTLHVLERFGEPMSEPSVIYRMQMCEFLKRQGVTVILAGDGGDEVFGGYPWYSLLRRYPGVKRVLASALGHPGLLRTIPALDRHLMPRVEVHRSQVGAALGDVLARKMRGNLQRLDCRHPAASEAVDEARAALASWIEAANITDVVDGALFGDLMLTLHHNHVMIPDAVGMSQSLELRSPFLDVRLVEFAAALPSEHKVSREPLLNKTILKRLLLRHLPEPLVYATKIGYGGNIRFLERHRDYWSSLLRRIVEAGVLTREGFAERPALERVAASRADTSPAEEIARHSVLMLGLWFDRLEDAGQMADLAGDLVAESGHAS